MTNDKQIPNCVFEDHLFRRRRLQRTLNKEPKRFNEVPKEQLSLIDQQKGLLHDMRCAALRGCAEEEIPAPVAAPEPGSMETPNAER